MKIPGGKALVLTPTYAELNKLNRFLEVYFPRMNRIGGYAVDRYCDQTCISINEKHMECGYCYAGYYAGSWLNKLIKELNFCTADDFIGIMSDFLEPPTLTEIESETLLSLL